MSDIHRLPLLGHDMPYYVVDYDEPERPRVFARRELTGQLYWYWSHPVRSGRALHGPFVTARDAGKEAEEWAREQASKTDKARPSGSRPEVALAHDTAS